MVLDDAHALRYSHSQIHSADNHGYLIKVGTYRSRQGPPHEGPAPELRQKFVLGTLETGAPTSC
jgi:hypothetical protein